MNVNDLLNNFQCKHALGAALAATALDTAVTINAAYLGWATTEMLGPYIGPVVADKVAEAYGSEGHASVRQVMDWTTPDQEIRQHTDILYGMLKSPAVAGKTTQAPSQEDMLKDASAQIHAFADAKGDLPEHRDAAYKQIEAMNSKPKGMEYEDHTLKYPNGGKVLGDMRGEPQGQVDFSDRGSLLPNRLAEPIFKNGGTATPSGNGALPDGGGIVQGPSMGPNGTAESNEQGKDKSGATAVRAVMTAVRKRNIQEKIKNAPANRPPGFEQALASLLKLTESDEFLKQDDSLDSRIKAGDEKAIQFFEFAKSYASGKGSLKDFEAALKRYTPAK